jgi:WD40 repeat protein
MRLFSIILRFVDFFLILIANILFVHHLHFSKQVLSMIKVAIGDLSGNILVYSYVNMSLLKKFSAHTDSVNKLKYFSVSTTNGYLASVSDDDRVKIWNTATWSLVSTFTGNTDKLYGLEIINTSYVISGGKDGQARISNVLTGGSVALKTFR